MSTFIPIPAGPHNERLEAYAEDQAAWQREHMIPDSVEAQMREFLKSHGVKFVFKKVFYIRASGGFIKRFHIVDFYLPEKNLIIHIGLKPYSEEDKYVNLKYADLKKQYAGIQIVHWCYKDFGFVSSLKKLVARIK